MSRQNWLAWARAALLVGLAWAWDQAIEPSAGEPPVLRWIRLWAEHPIRTTLALYLLDRAVSGWSPKDPERAKPSAATRGEGGPELE